MSINREHWRVAFPHFPNWRCPTCGEGVLVMDKDAIKFVETGPSRSGHAHEGWDPDWIEERFSGLLTCKNEACGEIVAIGGRTYTDWVQDDDGITTTRSFCPTFLSPAVAIFPIADSYPDGVVGELDRAFSLFWSDLQSCANRLRSAVEALLNEQKVNRTTLNKHNKRVPIKLHDRIVMFKDRDPDAAEFLLAIKWLGNSGSHTNMEGLTRDDLLNGFELFEHVLERVYVKSSRRLSRIAKTISARKGRPIKKKSLAAMFR